MRAHLRRRRSSKYVEYSSSRRHHSWTHLDRDPLTLSRLRCTSAGRLRARAAFVTSPSRALSWGMSFGKNPYLAKAQAAELKASEAPDSAAQARAYREAAHEWDRAAGREPPGKRKTEYEQNATRNRQLAEGELPEDAEPAGPRTAPGGSGRSSLN